MKNGPVYSNISTVNRAFRTFGSPLHIDLVVDYIRTHWENGKGIALESAWDLAVRPLQAQYYYVKAEEPDHFVRKEVLCSSLDELYKDMYYNPAPFQYWSRTSDVTMQQIYMDPRFDVISSSEGTHYLILNRWNLLNDLVYRFMYKNKIKKISLVDIYQQVIRKYQIDDPYAYFFPKIDSRFSVSRGNIVSIKDHTLSDEGLAHSVQITDYIREQVATRLPTVKSLLVDAKEAIKIRELIRKIFSIQPHFPLFQAYFEAIKQTVPFLQGIFLLDGDSLLYADASHELPPEKISVLGNRTNFNQLSEKVKGALASQSEAVTTTPTSAAPTLTFVKARETLSYTLRYFDRIQETLAAHYFRDWIENDHLKLTFIDEKGETQPFIFYYHPEQNVLHGEYLSNFMIDYDLAPGQKLEFSKMNETLYLKLGQLDEKAHTDQMKYEDIIRLAERKHVGSKSLMQALAELLMLHPAGLHIRQIVLDIQSETTYMETSIRSALSIYPFFEGIPNKIGYWRFNAQYWKKKYMEQPKTNAQKTHKQLSYSDYYRSIEPLSLQLKKQAYTSNKRRKCLTNQQYVSLPKEEFLQYAWEYYAFSIYHFAKNMSCHTIPLEDFYQEAFFALNRAYDNYKPQKGGSFYHYFKRYLYSHLSRMKTNQSHMIRIPVHRMEELKKLDQELYESLAFEEPIVLENADIEEYTLFKHNYISFEELFIKEATSLDDELQAKLYAFYEHPALQDEQITRSISLDLLDITEPDDCEELVIADHFEDQATTRIMANRALQFLQKQLKKQWYYDTILHRYGFTSGKEMTLEEIGKLYGVTRERIRQIEQKCLRILRTHKELKGVYH